MTNIETTHLTENAVDFYKVANNSVNKSKPPDCESLYFVELAEKWLRSEKLKTKESTFVQYNLILRNHIYPLLGKYLVVDIDRQTIEQTVIYYLSDGRLDGGGGLATKTTSDILMVIAVILVTDDDPRFPLTALFLTNHPVARRSFLRHHINSFLISTTLYHNFFTSPERIG